MRTSTTSKKLRKRYDATTLDSYITFVEHMSEVFSTGRSIADVDSVRDVLKTDKTSAATELLDQHLLTAWLNIAHGSLDWSEIGDVMRSVEEVRLEPTSTRQELLAQKRILVRLG